MGLAEFLKRIDYEPSDVGLFEQALTHRSFLREKPGSQHNERLEFLGDAVLNLALSHWLIERFPDEAEGMLSRARASLVNEVALAELATRLNLGRDLKLSHGERHSGGATKPRLLASCFEALVAAVYLDSGFARTQQAVLAIYNEQYSAALSIAELAAPDPKSALQELCQSQAEPMVPQYELLEAQGPDHSRRFTVAVSWNGEVYGRGSGASKKEAEQMAARAALERFPR